METHKLKVLSFNILANVFAHLKAYPQGVNEDLLDLRSRRCRILDVIQDHKQTADIICLQEVGESEFRYYHDYLYLNFTGFIALNSDRYKLDNIVDRSVFEPHGNAVFVRRELFDNISFLNVSLSDTGNSCAIVLCKHKYSNKRVRIASVHLDTDIKNKIRELNYLMDVVDIEYDIIDIVCGDFNFNGFNMLDIFEKNLFVDSIDYSYILNNKLYGKYYSPQYGFIDHIMTRNCLSSVGSIGNGNDTDIIKKNTVENINETLNRYGSNHLPIISYVYF
jgi:mRNA deadenylase 3'-5' endonuclease subunit Ccr4|uniref:Endonuclease/exonuclease/phosphatase superfamily n=1 Tax=Fadolivirus 2 TaxID=2740747 RepID=A0A7D3V829_9VIRU|nr:endonuclease/exonuclease/phosphatase superfamily [Fadolivirus 2]